MTSNQKKIHDALKAIGYEAKQIEWQTLRPADDDSDSGDPEGGWLVDNEPIGLSTQEALAFIEQHPNVFARK